MALFYPLTQGVPPELMSIFKLKSASGAHFQHTWTHFMQNSRNKQQAVKVKISKGLRSKSLKLEKFEVGKDRSWKKSTLQKFEVGNVLTNLSTKLSF